MRKLILAIALAASLGGCAELQRLQAIYDEANGTMIPPQTIYIAVNAFDAAKASAAQYFNYCRANLTLPRCSAANRRAVIKYVRAGTAARNQLETYLANNQPAPRAIFDTVKAAVDSLQASSITGAAQ